MIIYKHMRNRKRTGDTLIEVMLAIGIFSMVAISVTAVMRSGTARAQTALETTMTRNEIDAQAEALRFIQSSMVLEKGAAAGNQKFSMLWDEITKRANISKEEVISYNPLTCKELYDEENERNIYRQKAFVINMRMLQTDPTKALTEAVSASRSVFHETALYPRILYGTDTSSLITESTSTNLTRADGIFVVAVKDTGSTTVTDGGAMSKRPVYYDFYIRSCWYGSGANVPSTISTVVRLYDAEAK